MSGNEASAIGSLRAINSAQSTYSSSCGGNGYAQTLADLYAAPAGSTAGFISPDLNANGITKRRLCCERAGRHGCGADSGRRCGVQQPTQPALSAYFAEDHPATAGQHGPAGVCHRYARHHLLQQYRRRGSCGYGRRHALAVAFDLICLIL
jgi:hypothetical protein